MTSAAIVLVIFVVVVVVQCVKGRLGACASLLLLAISVSWKRDIKSLIEEDLLGLELGVCMK